MGRTMTKGCKEIIVQGSLELKNKPELIEGLRIIDEHTCEKPTDKFSFYESRSSNKIQSEFANREKDSIKQLKWSIKNK